MKRSGIFFILFLLSFVTKAQDSPVDVGEVLRIEDSKQFGYSYVNLPKANFIIKKGGTLNYDALSGTLVVVKEVRTNKKNESIVLLERKDGRKFFGSFPMIKARYKMAINSGELSRI